MVTKELEVYRVQMADDVEPQYVEGAKLDLMPEEERREVLERELVVRSGELLTLNAADAVELGFAVAAVGSRLELYDKLGLEPDNVTRLYLTGSEKVLTMVDTISPLLIVAGLVLVFIEVSNQGFGLPGILGIACFVAFFLVKLTLQYARLLEILLFAVGVGLLLVELFITPGFGLFGGLGMALIFVSLVLMFQQFTFPGSSLEWQALGFNLLTVLGTFIVSAAAVFALIRNLESVPVLKRLVLRSTQEKATAEAAAGRAGPRLHELVGQVGVALTPLRPAGRAAFGEEQADVVTQGEFLEQGARVEVLEVQGARVVVREHTEA
jgi:membrane-bound serine protease (ClpP class)